MNRRVKIEKDGVESEVLPQTVHVWEKRGWTLVDDGSSESAATPARPEPKAQTTFNYVAPDKNEE